jgi:hypothetical protein
VIAVAAAYLLGPIDGGVIAAMRAVKLPTLA